MPFPTIEVQNINDFIDGLIKLLLTAIDNMKKFIAGFTSKSALDGTAAAE